MKMKLNNTESVWCFDGTLPNSLLCASFCAGDPHPLGLWTSGQANSCPLAYEFSVLEVLSHDSVI